MLIHIFTLPVSIYQSWKGLPKELIKGISKASSVGIPDGTTVLLKLVRTAREVSVAYAFLFNAAAPQIIPQNHQFLWNSQALSISYRRFSHTILTF